MKQIITFTFSIFIIGNFECFDRLEEIVLLRSTPDLAVVHVALVLKPAA